eukprot:6191483-Pleurochrysis_carterae.AAC.2
MKKCITATSKYLATGRSIAALEMKLGAVLSQKATKRGLIPPRMSPRLVKNDRFFWPKKRIDRPQHQARQSPPHFVVVMCLEART